VGGKRPIVPDHDETVNKENKNKTSKDMEQDRQGVGDTHLRGYDGAGEEREREKFSMMMMT
jgi:predicted deacetylase